MSCIQSNRDAVAFAFDFRMYLFLFFFHQFFFSSLSSVLFFVEKVHLIIDYKTSQGNREEEKNMHFLFLQKKIIYSVNKWEFIFLFRRVCVCARACFSHFRSPPPRRCCSLSHSSRRRIAFETKYEIFFACRRLCSTCSAWWLRVHFAC